MSAESQAVATLDLRLVKQLVECFPNDPWKTIFTRIFIADRNEQFFSDWSSTKHCKDVGGVYALLLPTIWFSPARIMDLHGPNKCAIPFEFTLPDLMDGYGVVYVGKSSNLCQRWQGHLTPGKRKDGGQVKHGLIDCGLARNEESALRILREHARIIYTELSAPEHCANRDMLEMSLCTRFAPPFNIKSER
jgi:hypothetical protein